MVVTHIFDDTGSNPDNYIDNEIHQVSNLTTRIIVPQVGLFYTANFELINQSTNQPYTLNSDYTFQLLIPEVSAMTGLEVAGAVELTNPSIITDVKLKYHAVGGLEGESSYLVKELLKKLELLNNTTVTWDMVKNKPQEFTTAPRPLSVVSDLANLEVIRNTITDIKLALSESKGGAKSVFNVNSRLDSLLAIITSQRNDINTLANAISVTNNQAVNTLIQNLRHTLPPLELYPTVNTPSKTLLLTVPSAGKVRVVGNQAFVLNGIKVFNTNLYSTVLRTFSTIANKTYHLRFDEVSGFNIQDLDDLSYNPNSLPETDVRFDSSLVDMLVALITTDSSNVSTISSLINSHLLKQIVVDNVVVLGSAATTPVAATLNWARTPTNLSQSVVNDDGSNVVSGSLIPVAGSVVNRYGGTLEGVIAKTALGSPINVIISTVITA